MLEPEIAQAMVYGDRRPHLVALIVPDDETVKVHDGDTEGLTKAVGEAIKRASAGLSPIETVKRFALAAEPFTIDNGEMTPTMKTRRHAIIGRYGDVLDGLY